MDSLKRSMRWDEERFGREYDLDVFSIVAVSDFNMGAMENKGLNIFNDALVLASPETATDAAFINIERVIAHEYFHNWTGNRITCRDWFQLCLKEGLTVFRDQEFSADQRSRAIQRIKDVRALRRTQFPEDSGPLAHPVRPESYVKIDNFYTRTVYEKGAEIVRMMRETLGPEAFRAGMDRYFADCDGTAATVEDFIASLEKGSGSDLSGFMIWYRQAGTPHLTVQARHDEAARTLDLTLTQHTPPTPGQAQKQPAPIPVRVGFLEQDGRSAPMRLEGENAPGPDERLLVLESASRTWRFTGLETRPVVSALRGFSAPVIVEQAHSAEETALLSRHDPDLFNRWEAGQALMRDLLVAMSKGEAADAAGVSAIWRAQLADPSLDPAFVALALTPPSEAEIAQLLTEWDPAAVREARETLLRQAAEDLRPELEAAMAAMVDTSPASVDAESVARRALKNAALLTLSRLGARAVEGAAWRQFEDAATMTDVLAAIAALDVAGSAKFDKALDAFYERWKQRPLALDKWFSVQAGSPRPDVLERVKHLARHQRFDASNPNRVRALVGAFAMGNPARFHAADGSGYDFLAEWVLTIDRANPALAARLLGAMESWGRLEPVRKAQAKAALQRVKAGAASKNVIEIAGRSLAGAASG
jgi:aminopeptidase N